jgi:hypothetical protein
LSIKTLKNGPQKLLIIGPDPFISQSSPDHSPQPRIDLSYYEISGPDICSLICDAVVGAEVVSEVDAKVHTKIGAPVGYAIVAIVVAAIFKEIGI